MSTPEKKPDAPDEMERLEKVHRRMKAEQEAWRHLLESLGNLKKKPEETTEPEKPNT